MRKILIAILALALVGCDGGAAEPLSGVDPVETTTTTSVPATTTSTTTIDPGVALRAWFNDDLQGFFDRYNSEFAPSWGDHINNHEYSDARLDCIEFGPQISEWIDEVPPSPDESADALAREVFDRIEEAIILCRDAETLGDWRGIRNVVDQVQPAMDRLIQRVDAAS